jgi:CPA2 family monovalent cation:H+ antiporter-2
VHASPYLQELVLVFGVALVLVVVLARARLPAIAGFVAAGALIGPGGFGLVADTRLIEAVAEVGVVLLLFTIGLELSLGRLRRIWRSLVFGGTMQVGATILAVLAIGTIVGGVGARRAVFFGFLVSLSSTAIVLRVLAERREVDAPHGRIILGVLLFQDLCVVPMMLLVPLLGGETVAAGTVLWALAKAAALMAGTLLLGRLVLPRALELVTRAGQRDLFVLAVLLACTGIAWLTSLAGLSLALGAFLAGVALADSGYGEQAMSDVLPFRETLASLFFVSIGMLFDPRVILRHSTLVLGLLVALLGGKALIGGMTARLMRFPPRIAVLTGLGLAQIGEFSFVLAKAGVGGGLLRGEEMPVFVAVSVLTMAVTPILLRLGPHLAAITARLLRRERKPSDGAAPEPEDHELGGHVIIAGYGHGGRLLSEALGATGISFLVLEMDARRVSEARRAGHRVLYGDATSAEILRHAGIERAIELVVVISDPGGELRCVAVARHLRPELPILVRSRYLTEVVPLEQVGATDVVVQEFETGVEILARVLREAAVPRNVIHEWIERTRKTRAQVARPIALAERRLGELGEAHALPVETFLVRDQHWVYRRALGELHTTVRGVTVIALGREGTMHPSPHHGEEIQEGDLLYILGGREALARALEVLARGPEEPDKAEP